MTAANDSKARSSRPAAEPEVVAGAGEAAAPYGAKRPAASRPAAAGPRRSDPSIESPGSAGARTDAERRAGSIESPGSAGARSDAERRAGSIESPGSAGARTDAVEPPSRASQVSISGKRVVSDKREAILNAALELFVERGFYGTAVPEIADRAGVGAGTIYRYFDSKEALVNAMYRQHKLRFAHVVLDDFPPTAPSRDQFRMLWMRMARFAIDQPNAFIFLELHHHARYLDPESRALEQRMTDLFVHVVTNAQARHELKAGPPRLLMGIVMGAFVGVIRSCVEVEQRLDDADWQLAEQCVWESVRS